MPKRYSSKEIVRTLGKFGFDLISQKGSHMKYRKDTDGKYTVIVPADKKEIPAGTFRSILRQSGLSESDFIG